MYGMIEQELQPQPHSFRLTQFPEEEYLLNEIRELAMGGAFELGVVRLVGLHT